MKAAALVLGLALLVASTCLAPVLAGPLYSPHENPDEAEPTYHVGLPVLLHYAEVLSVLAEGKYSDTLSLMSQLDVDRSAVPDDVKIVMETYNGLLADFAAKLDSLDAALAEIEQLLEAGDLEEVRGKLTVAAGILDKVGTRLVDVEEATDQLVTLLGPLGAPTELESVKQAKWRLREAERRLAELDDIYQTALEQLEAEVEQVSEAQYQTGITLHLDKSEAWIGESIIASGVLRPVDNDGLLADREVGVLCEGKVLAVATTDADGSYQVAVTVPCRYVASISLRARYSPQGQDRELYLPCASPEARLKVDFDQPRLEIDVPDRVYPGLPFNVTCWITSGISAPPDGRQIEVLWDNQVVAACTSSEDELEVKVRPSAGAAVGEHELEVRLKAHERSAGAVAQRTVTVIKAPIEVVVDRLEFDTLSRKLRLAGHLGSDLPFSSADVRVCLAGASTTVQASTEGTFEATLGLPLGATIMGTQEVEITVEPLESWYLPGRAEASVFAMDIVNLALVSVAALSVGVVLYARRRGKPGETGPLPEKMSSLTPYPGEPSPPASREAESTPARILACYADAAEAVGRATGISLRPNITLREFLKRTAPELREAAEAFTELTYLSEECLYSPRVPGEASASRAKGLALAVKKGVGGGHA